jgi:hypothetical protein
MPKGTLTGHAIKVVGLPADHTYVTSDDGRIWPCFGRSVGGAPICSGSGNVDQADCLSQPAQTAGIRYAFSGVCHQTANRILHPSSVYVSKAAGYRTSVLMYGTYGRDLATGVLYSPAHNAWPELATCHSHAHP